MTVFSGDPRVILAEIDISDRPPNPLGVTAYIGIHSTKGPWKPNGGTNRLGRGIPTLVSDLTALFDLFGVPDLDSDPAYQTAMAFLRYSGNLYVQRVGEGNVAETLGTALLYGSKSLVQQPIADVANATDVSPTNTGTVSLANFKAALSGPTSPSDAAERYAVPYLSATLPASTHGGAIIIEFLSTTTYKVMANDGVTTVLAGPFTVNTTVIDSANNASSGLYFKLSTPASGAFATGDTFKIPFVQGFRTVYDGSTEQLDGATLEPFTFTAPAEDFAPAPGYEDVILYGKNPGAWNNNLSFQILIDPNQSMRLSSGADITSADAAKGSYLLRIFDNGTMVENFPICIYDKGVDGFGRSGFITDVLIASKYVQAIVRPAFAASADSTLPLVTTALALVGGQDTVFDDDDDAVAAYVEAAKAIEDTDAYAAVTLLLGGSWGSVPSSTPGSYNTTYAAELARIAEARGDSVALIGSSLSSENNADPLSVESNEYSVLNEVAAVQAGVGARQSYVAMYSPHLVIADSVTGRQTTVSPDGYVGGIISAAEVNFERWYPPAGWRRGLLDVRDLNVRFDSTQRGVLFDAMVNPIRYQRGRGIVVWGDKTVQSRPTQLSYISTRLLLTDIKPRVQRTLDSFVFEINDEITRSTVLSLITGMMSDYQARRGVQEYRVKCDAENNPPSVTEQKRLVVWVFIKPLDSINYVNVSLIITRSSVSLQLLSEVGGF